MNRIRIIGAIILLIGILLNIYLENEVVDFLSGLLIGLGIGLILTGRFSKLNKKNASRL